MEWLYTLWYAITIITGAALLTVTMTVKCSEQTWLIGFVLGTTLTILGTGGLMGIL